MDTLIWIVDFFASHGYIMVFIAAFSAFGLLPLALRRVGAPRLVQTDLSGGESLVTGGSPRSVLGIVQTWVYRALAVVVIGGGVVGLLSLFGVPVTRGYIHAHGVAATGVYDGSFLRFSTTAGVEYTLPVDFFTPAMHPDAHAYIPWDEPIVVRYLADHPQAYVVDSTQLP